MDNNKSKFEAKWPKPVADRGFVPIPKCLITCMKDLDLKPQEAVILFNIIEKCWKAGDSAWFSVDYLGENIGKKHSAITDTTTKLVKKGFINKHRRFNTTNLYSLEPTAKKLAEHTKHCRHLAKKLGQYRQEPGDPDRQNIGDYIEPVLNRTNYIKPSINSRNSNKIEADDQTNNYGLCFGNTNGERHDWREFEVEKSKDGIPYIRYYFTCIHCDVQYHKDGKKPWQAEYPILSS